MDAKDLRTEAVNETNNDGSKYSQASGITLHCDRNKSYQDIGSNSLGKVDVANVRPCAVIGPDRIVPPAASDAYHNLKKGAAEPWPCMDNTYRRPPDYPHKLPHFQNPTRNISPRQTFQENMQRIMVPPTFKLNDDTNNYGLVSDRSNGLSKTIKLNVPPEAKFCDVPYTVNEQKNVRNPEMCLPSVNPTVTRTNPHGWPPGSVNLRSTRMYGAPELYQYQDYPSCAGPRPVVPRPHRTVQEDQGYVYADQYYQEGNIRFKPYPSVKERYPQQRYEYIGNYSNPFQPPPGFPPHKYELQKSMPPHPYSPYPPVKYIDSRASDPALEGYQRNPQGNYNISYRNQVLHPSYGQVIGNCPQNKIHSYPPDPHIKTIGPNKLPYDNNAKQYIEYENNRPKMYPPSESYFVNEMGRMQMKSQVIMPNYPPMNMHNIQPNPYLKKDHQQIKNFEHMSHYRNMDPNMNVHNLISRHPSVFSPNAIAISPTDSSTSNDTTQTLGTSSQEDFGYVSQSSAASVRSMDSGINRIPNDCIRKYYDSRYGPIVKASHIISRSHINSNNNNNNVSKEKKSIDVRQFLQMWNEGDEESEEHGPKDIIIQTGSSDKNNYTKSHTNQEQLYVLGLVNVPSEELDKYEHIQKVSKLPENIKGYNSIELLNQFEEVIESSNMNNYKSPTPKEFHMSMKTIPKQVTGIIPTRPVSPLDVEAKISQSVIHKEVGCNFEIKPCSPKMLNVEVAAPIQNMLAERSIEKVANPVINKSPMLNNIDEINCNMLKRPDHLLNENVRIPSCKMLNTQFANNNSLDPIKNSYSLQDLESNSGLCLSSLPRLDNDIELNFPEVNQQFINANKSDSSVLNSPIIRDLPNLDIIDQSDNQTREQFDNKNTSRTENDIIKSPYMPELEKEFPKLSKYRKTKIIPTETKDNKSHNINAVRTNSVIIKNPENNKNIEDNLALSPNISIKVAGDIQQGPINLTSQSISSNVEEESLMNNLDNVIENKELPIEIAIDFSLNKSCILESLENAEIKYESVTEASKEMAKNDLSSTEENADILCTSSMTVENPEDRRITSFESHNDSVPMKTENTDTNFMSDNNEISTDMVNNINFQCDSDHVIENMSIDITKETNSIKQFSEFTNEDCLMNIDKEIKTCNSVDSGDNKLNESESSIFDDSYKDCSPEYEDAYKEMFSEYSKPLCCDMQDITEKCDVNATSKPDNDSDTMNVILVSKDIELREDSKELGLPLNEREHNNNIDNDCDQLGTVSSSVLHIGDNYGEIKHTLPLDRTSNEENINYKDCEDAQNINSFEETKNVVKNEMQIERLPSQWYGSKEMYSPWIQNLIIYTEGNIHVISLTDNPCKETPTTEDKVQNPVTKTEIKENANCGSDYKNPQEHVTYSSLDDTNNDIAIGSELSLESDISNTPDSCYNLEQFRPYDRVENNPFKMKEKNNSCEISTISMEIESDIAEDLQNYNVHSKIIDETFKSENQKAEDTSNDFEASSSLQVDGNPNKIEISDDINASPPIRHHKADRDAEKKNNLNSLTECPSQSSTYELPNETLDEPIKLDGTINSPKRSIKLDTVTNTSLCVLEKSSNNVNTFDESITSPKPLEKVMTASQLENEQLNENKDELLTENNSFLSPKKI